MKALTYTIIAGSRACDNDCPICISKMTPDFGMGYGKPEVNWENFDKATTVALNHGANNVLITSKGEPALFPGQVSQYLIRLYGKPFDRREIQTDGSVLARGGLYDEFLDVWKFLGLDVVAISIYHYDSRKNMEMFRPRSGKYFDLPKLIEKIHSKGMQTRLSCVMLDGYIDSVGEVESLIDFARDNNVFQLTLRRADMPKNPLDQAAAEFVDKYRLSDEKSKEIENYLDKVGTKCYTSPHGAVVYEVYGQNVCITTGLSYDQGRDEIRQLIFFPQGWLTTSWENVKGNRIL
jgi:hypothetical protein